MNDDEVRAFVISQIESLLRLEDTLKKVRRLFDENEDYWEYSALWAIREFLREMQFDRHLIDPIQKMLLDKVTEILKGRCDPEDKSAPRKTRGTVAAMSSAAAAVTELKRRHGQTVSQALRLVSRSTGLSEQEIGRYRNALSNEKNAPIGGVEAQAAATRVFKDLTRDEILQAVAGVAIFVDKGRAIHK